MSRSTLLVITAVLVSLSSGCAAMSGRAAATATARSLQQLGEEDAQQYFSAFMRSPSMRMAAEDLGESAGRGIAIVVSEKAPHIVEALAAAEQSHHLLGALASTAAREVVREMDGLVDGKLGPAAGRAIRDDIGPALAGTVRRDIAPALAGAIRQEFGPALGGAIRQDIGPALSDGIDVDLDEALARSARTVGRESVIGSHEGLVALREQPGSLLGGALRFGIGTMQIVILAVGVVLGVLIGLLIQSRRNERRERARADERESTLLEVVRALRQEPVG